MELILREIEANFDQFSSDWQTSLETVKGELSGDRQEYLESYTRLISLHSWRVDFLKTQISEGSLSFFLEAHNDALVSHVFARCGAWRSALKSLRSTIENICFCLYYMDHGVELKQWHLGQHKLGFSATLDYLEHHPAIEKTAAAVDPFPILAKEYAMLSRAVHGSSELFRMTNSVNGTLLWSSERANLGAWTTRESKTLTGINLLLLAIFRDQLQGTQYPSLRKAIGLSLPGTTRTAVKTNLKITL